jgi:tetratricopeptide (TPR) repeat protein
VGDLPHAIAARRLTGTALRHLGRYAEATASLEAALEECAPAGSLLERARVLGILGWLSCQQAECGGEAPCAAVERFQAAHAAAVQSGELFTLLDALLGLTRCALAAGDPEDGDAHLAEVRRRLIPGMRPELDAGVAACRAAAAHARGDTEAAERLYRHAATFTAIRGWASRALVGLGALRWHAGRRQEAEECWREALHLAERISPHRRRLAERAIARCRADARALPL